MVSKTRVFDKPSSAHDELSAQLIDAIESVRDGFALYGSDERLIFCNSLYRNFYPSIANMLKPGARLEDLTRTAYEAGAIQGSALNIEARIEQRLVHYRTAEGTHEQQLKDGRWLLCSDRRTPNGSIACIRTEITERKQAEEALRDAHDGLELQVEERTSELRKAKESAEAAEDHLSKVYQSSPALFTISSPKDGQHFKVNDAWSSITGYSHEEALQKTALELNLWVKPEDRVNFIEEINNQGFIRNYETVFRTKYGVERDMLISGDLIDFRGEEALLVVGQDITQQKLAEKELRKLSRAVEFSSSAVYVTDAEHNIEYINPKFTEITGYTSEEAIGKSPHDLLKGETLESVYTELRKIISSGGEWKGDLNNRKKDGSYYWARNSISGVKDTNGIITNYIGIQDDVTQEIELKQKLDHQASYDNLTGLINRYEFERRAKRLLSSLEQGEVDHALCFMDLDQFKVINDTCGHAAGDELLRQLGQVLQRAVRHSDTLARLGGDEFGVLMEHCSLDQAQRVAESLKWVIKGFQFVWEGHVFKISASIGLVAINETTPNFTELLKQADAACYMAKELGRNRIHVYHPEDTKLAQRHGQMQWVARINQALEEDRFCLYAQPIVPLDNSARINYEILLRMVNEEGEIIPPGAFLPAAERYDLIGDLDRWVIENALALLADNPSFIDKIHFVSINLSGQSLMSANFLDFVMAQLKQTAIEAGKICFEVTETLAISNLYAATTFISTLKEKGCHFALDDFGSGFSSFGYLKNLSVDYLKIDGVFVQGIVDDVIDRAMVKSINDIAQVMGMQTIAEYVENEEIKTILSGIGVNYVQGYGIGKPQPFDEIIELTIFN